jgi:hypothetical protein
MTTAIAGFSSSEGRHSRSAFPLHFGPGLAQAGDAVAGFPLIALSEQFDPLEAFEDISFCAGRAGGAKAAML